MTRRPPSDAELLAELGELSALTSPARLRRLNDRRAEVVRELLSRGHRRGELARVAGVKVKTIDYLRQRPPGRA